MEFIHMSKNRNGLSDHKLSHWFPTKRSSHVGAGRKTKHRKQRGRGGAQPNEDAV
jgi:hypothetical protein